MASRAYWDKILQDLERSGLTPTQYAKAKKLNSETLRYHRKRQERERGAITLNGAEVHELNLHELTQATQPTKAPPPPAPPAHCELKAGGTTLTLSELPPADWLAALIRALRR